MMMRKEISRTFKLFFATVLAFSITVSVASAAVPSTLSYQGRLTNTNGDPVSDTGTYYACFSIWTTSGAGTGTKLWPTTVSPTTITPKNGVFSAQVGIANDISTFDFSATSPAYLQVGISTVNNCTSPEVLDPRQSIDATAYARVAESVYGGSVQVGDPAGVPSGQKLLSLAVKTVADTIGLNSCSPNGAMWYNSGNGRAMVCNQNLYQVVGSSIKNQFFDVSGPTGTTNTDIKTFAFPNVSAKVLTDNSAVLATEGGTGQTLYAIGDLLYASATNALSRLAKGTANQVLSMDVTGTNVTWVTPAAGGGTPGGADTQIQFNNAGAFGGSADFTWNNTTKDLTLGGVDTGITLNGVTNEPPLPLAGDIHIYAKSIAGRVMPKWVGPAGVDVPFQAFVGQDKIGWWNPSGNGTTVPGVLGFTAPTAVGTATARNVATTRFFTRTRRLGYVSSTITNSCAGHYNVAAGTQYTVGDGTGLGGFFYVARFGTSDAATVALAREFVGMTATVAAPAGATEPSTFTNSIGVGHGAADANLKLFYGGSAAQTPIDLGVNFPKNTLSTDLYELILFAPPNANNKVGYKVTRLNTGAVAEGMLTAATPGTQLPAATTLLGHRAYRANGSTGAAVGIDVASVYISSDQ